MSKRPSFQFYPGDWRADPGLRLCSIAARGLWIEMTCIMHEGEPYGHLTVQGRPIDPAMLARLVGEGAPAVKRWLAELGANDVFSRTEEGVIFSRRMVRDEQVRELRAAGGKEGAKHGHKGAEHGAKGGRPKADETPLPDDARGVFDPPIKPPPSSSSPSPSAEEVPFPNGNGAADPEKLMFDSGIRLLTAAGRSEANSRSLIAKWKQAHGAPEVITAIGEAVRLGITEPVSWFEARWKTRGKGTFEFVGGPC